MILGKRKSEEERVNVYQKELVMDELEKAKKYLEVALYQFNNCEDLFFDVANQQLTIARQKLNLAIMKAKLVEKKDLA